MNLRDVDEAKGGVVLHETLALPRVAEENRMVERIDPVTADLIAHKADRLYHVDGAVETVIWYMCSRCLETFSAPLHLPFAEVFTRDAARVEDEIIYAPDDDVLLDPFIEQTINLAIEYRPLCREDCKGLCPVCGKNRNLEPCDCNPRPVDPRWAALQDLLSPDESE